MTLPEILNASLCSLVVYCVIVRLNMLHGPGNFLQRVSMWLILIGVCFQGFSPLVDDYHVEYYDLFLPAGLAAFFIRYVHKVEKFYKRVQ
jgi:hypothetical protein